MQVPPLIATLLLAALAAGCGSDKPATPAANTPPAVTPVTPSPTAAPAQKLSLTYFSMPG